MTAHNLLNSLLFWIKTLLTMWKTALTFSYMYLLTRQPDHIYGSKSFMLVIFYRLYFSFALVLFSFTDILYMWSFILQSTLHSLSSSHCSLSVSSVVYFMLIFQTLKSICIRFTLQSHWLNECLRSKSHDMHFACTDFWQSLPTFVYTTCKVVF